MTISEWLAEAQLKLSNASVPTARLDALILLSDVLRHDKSWLLAHTDERLRGSDINFLSKKIVQRAQHIPMAYLRGKAEFYGREFAISEGVLVPRPESESMIDLLKGYEKHEPINTVVDVGTGSGILAITAALELPEKHIYAMDIDPICLQIAQQNAKQLRADVQYLEGDLLLPMKIRSASSGKWLVLANLPYVPDDYPINTAATHEPVRALFGGNDGLDLYRTLFAQAATLQNPPVAIITEALKEQHIPLQDIALASRYSLSKTDSLAQLYVLQA